MAFKDCLNEIVKAGVNEKEAKRFLTIATKKIDSGVSPQKLLDDINEIAEARKALIRKTREFNVVRDFSIRQAMTERVISSLEGKHHKFLGKTIYTDLEDRVLGIVRQHENWRNQLEHSFKVELSNKIMKQDLQQFFFNKANEGKIAEEIAALTTLKDKPTVSRTGDEKAFQIANAVVDLRNKILQRKRAAGSTIGFLENRVGKNAWDSRKFGLVSDDEFYDLVKDIKWGDDLATREEWLQFKRKVQSNNYRDIETELLYSNADDVIGGFTSGGSLAEFSGLSRKIDVTPQDYIRIADKLFSGDSLAERINYELIQDARIITDLEVFGSKPIEQFKNILSEIKAQTRDLDLYKTTEGKSILDSAFYSGTANEDGIIVKTMFRSNNIPSDVNLSNFGNITRSLTALGKLSGSIITAQMDVATKAIKTVMQTEKRSVFAGIIDAYADLARQIGKPAARQELHNFSVGLDTLFDDLQGMMHRFDPSQAQATGQNVKRANQIIEKAFKLNGLEWWTNANLRASYVSAMSVAANNAGKSLDQIDNIFKDLLLNNGITKQEWDFIRTKGITKDLRANKLLSVERLNELDLEEYSHFYEGGAKTTQLLEVKRNEIVSKWNAVLYQEAQTMTIMPDVVDRARLLRGTRAGTFTGEAMRFATQFKSFSFAYAARVVSPLLRKGALATQAEYVAALITLGMLNMTVKDLVKGRTPRDFRKPKNMLGIFGLAVGLPFLDQITFMLASDNPQASTIYDGITGPVVGDFVDTTLRAQRLLQKGLKGDLESDDIGKALTQTFMPMAAFRNYPVVSIGYNNLLYNKFMDSFTGGDYSEKIKGYWDEEGSKDYTGTL